MGAVALIFRAELRRRWRSWLALAILVSLVGGIVLAATAAGRRTTSAFPSFVTAYGFDALAYAVQPVPHLARLPEVASADELLGALSGQPTCTCAHVINAADFGVIVPKSPRTPAFGRLLSGHLPDPSAPDQVLASQSLQQDDGVQIGTVIHVPFDAPSQFSAAFNGTPLTPDGPLVALRVVGIEVSETDFPGGEAPTYDLIGTQAFARTVIPRTAFAVEYLVRLRSGADLPRFNADVNALSSDGVAGSMIEAASAASVEAAIHPQAVGWWILAALAALAGLAVIGQALSRQSVVEGEDHPALTALGLDRRQFFALAMTRNLGVGLVGAAGAVALAIALSPLAPVGEARLAEASTGLAFDSFVLPLGALATVVIVLALGTWPALHAARALTVEDRAPSSGPPALVAGLIAIGAPPERGHRRPQRVAAGSRVDQRPGEHCPSWHGPRGRRAKRNGGLRCQPLSLDGDAEVVRQ